MTMTQWRHWKDHVFKRTDPGIVEQVPEKYGDFMYFITEKEFEKSKFAYKNKG